jgi:hypothetical protein
VIVFEVDKADVVDDSVPENFKIFIYAFALPHLQSFILTLPALVTSISYPGSHSQSVWRLLSLVVVRESIHISIA